MCGRMTMRTRPSELERIFDAEVREPDAFDALGPRYNVAPTQPIPAIVQREDGRALELHRWGLVPTWATSPAVGARMINARAETVAISSAFRPSFLRWRCVIPADGFYEWRQEGRHKVPFLIHAADDRPLAFAGLWAPWRDPATGQWLLSASVVTTASDATVGRLHDRMPVILGPEEWPLWIDPELRDEMVLRDLLRAAAGTRLQVDRVSPLVNDASHEGPELVRIEPPAAGDSQADEPLTLFGRSLG